MKKVKILILVLIFSAISASAQLVFEEPPEHFNPKVEVAACFLFDKDNVLFLKRQPHKPQGNTWGIPGGKMEKGETAKEAVLRELKEETGLDLVNQEVKYHGKVYIRYPTGDFIYHMFEHVLNKRPEVLIDPSEHSAYKWITFKEALSLPLIPGEEECIHLVYH